MRIIRNAPRSFFDDKYPSGSRLNNCIKYYDIRVQQNQRENRIVIRRAHVHACDWNPGKTTTFFYCLLKSPFTCFNYALSN
jgi:hypothetical protein